MTAIVRIVIVAFLVSSCSTAANPTTTPLDHRHVTFAGSPPTPTGRTHQGSPPQ